MTNVTAKVTEYIFILRHDSVIMYAERNKSVYLRRTCMGNFGTALFIALPFIIMCIIGGIIMFTSKDKKEDRKGTGLFLTGLVLSMLVICIVVSVLNDIDSCCIDAEKEIRSIGEIG